MKIRLHIHRWKQGTVPFGKGFSWGMRQCLKCRAREIPSGGRWVPYGLFEPIEGA